MNLQIIEETKYFSGRQLRVKHKSSANHCDMAFSLFLPKEAEEKKVPLFMWLSGLTCTDQNFVQKSGMQRYAAEYGLAVLAPDTSPRGEEVPDDPEGAWDFGLGAGFYVPAQKEPWAQHYQMYSYIVDELPQLVFDYYPIRSSQVAISGHSMGGHGALMIALKNPDRFSSASAFAPIASPINCPWGQKAFTNYLGKDRELWKEFDLCELIKKAQGKKFELLVDQGTQDNFLEGQLKTHLLEEACQQSSYPLKLRWQQGYDHSYSFISTFISDHIAFHSKQIKSDSSMEGVPRKMM